MSKPPLRFEAAEGAAVLELDPEALAELAADRSSASPWSVVDEPDWSRYESLRLLAGRFEDRTVAALVALRPVGAAGHDGDETVAVVSERGRDFEDAHRALLSTELDSDGLVRRVGVEIWGSEEPPPRRLAADRSHAASTEAGSVKRSSTLLEARIDGEPGVAIFELLRPA